MSGGGSVLSVTRPAGGAGKDGVALCRAGRLNRLSLGIAVDVRKVGCHRLRRDGYCCRRFGCRRDGRLRLCRVRHGCVGKRGLRLRCSGYGIRCRGGRRAVGSSGAARRMPFARSLSGHASGKHEQGKEYCQCASGFFHYCSPSFGEFRPGRLRRRDEAVDYAITLSLYHLLPDK